MISFTHHSSQTDVRTKDCFVRAFWFVFRKSCAYLKDEYYDRSGDENHDGEDDVHVLFVKQLFLLVTCIVVYLTPLGNLFSQTLAVHLIFVLILTISVTWWVVRPYAFVQW